MKIAAVDIGTNSVLLLIAERRGEDLTAVLERATITRLGEGVDRNHRLLPQACERTVSCLKDYAALIVKADVERVGVVGTSALRDAEGSGAFLNVAEKVLGVRPVVISGREEAELTFLGALSGLHVEGPVTVLDIGGGSTEIAYGTATPERRLDHAVSLNLGSVRLTERLFKADPPSSAELSAAEDEIRAALSRTLSPSADTTVVGVAGTVTQLAALDLALPRYDPQAVHGHLLTAESLRRLVGQLTLLPCAARQGLPGMHPARADVIVAGAQLLKILLDWTQKTTLRVSDRGVRWGLAARL